MGRLITSLCALAFISTAAWAASQVEISDPTTNTNRAKVNSDGSLSTSPMAYPSGATPLTASATGTTAATTATLAGTTGKTTYICGFRIDSKATAAAAGNATITGVITGTLTIQMPTAATPAIGTTAQTFTPCVPASGTNQAIAVVSAAPGTGGVISVNAWGYQL